ncbi:MAG: hypothetical protein ACLR4Z_08530 [Butyricicoccaceae bacterium]
MCSSNSFWGENSWWWIIILIILIWVCCGQEQRLWFCGTCGDNTCGCGSAATAAAGLGRHSHRERRLLRGMGRPGDANRAGGAGKGAAREPHRWG